MKVLTTICLFVLALALLFTDLPQRALAQCTNPGPGGNTGASQYKTSAGSLGGSAVIQACAFTGATADVQINAAIAALPSAGGTVDARCYGGTTQTIAATVTLPATGNQKTVLLVDNATTFNCTINNVANPCWLIQSSSSIIGQGEAAVGGLGFELANGANVLTEVQMDGSGGGGNHANTSLENVEVNGNAGATVVDGLIYIHNMGNMVTVRGIQSSGQAGGIMLIFDDYGPSYFENNYLDCSDIAGKCTPVTIKSDGTFSGVHELTFIGGLYAHPGQTSPTGVTCPGNDAGCTPIFDVQDAGANVNSVAWYNVAEETHNTTDVGWNLTRCAGCSIIQAETTRATTSGTDMVAITGGSNEITVVDTNNVGLFTDMIYNSVASPSLTIANNNAGIAYYNWQGNVATTEWTENTSNGGTITMDNNGLFATKLGIGSAPTALANLPACAAGTEGLIGRATTCASNSPVGTTCSGTGTTHSQVECNGTNWIELGY